MAGAQEPLVRITLLKESYPGQVVRIPGGQVNYLDSIATNISINPADPAFQVPYNKDENVLAYGRRDGQLEKIDLHQNIIFDISMQDGQNSTLVPIGVAKINFGDWDIKPGMAHPMNPRCTYEAERQRVAMRWGGYKLFPFNRTSPNGQPQADTRKIGVPEVPHVKIEAIDQRGLPTGECIVVWDFYKWETSVDRNAAAEANRRLQDVGYDAANPRYGDHKPEIDIEAMIEAAVQKRLGKKAAGVSS